MLDMRRREFITLLGGAATWPLAVRAQEAGRGQRVPHVGILNYAAAHSDAARVGPSMWNRRAIPTP